MSEINVTAQQLYKLYHEDDLSIREIGRRLHLSFTQVRQLLIKLKVPLKDKTIANAKSHKTQAFKDKISIARNSAKNKFSQAISARKAWMKNAKNRKLQSERLKKRWAEMPPEEKQLRMKKLLENFKRSGVVGSSFEKFLVELLQKDNYVVLYHQTHAIQNEKMHLDILLPEHNIAIEIDGITHYEPIFGEEKLKKYQEADITKNNLLIANGLHLIRVAVKKRRVGTAIGLDLYTKIKTAIEFLTNETEPKIIRIGVDDDE